MATRSTALLAGAERTASWIRWQYQDRTDQPGHSPDGDFRDWAAIENWAATIADALR